MDNHAEFMEASEEEIFLAMMDALGVKVTPAGPKPPEVW